MDVVSPDGESDTTADDPDEAETTAAWTAEVFGVTTEVVSMTAGRGTLIGALSPEFETTREDAWRLVHGWTTGDE